MKLKPIVGITLGDPSGIGPEVAIKAATSSTVRRICVPLLIGSPILAMEMIKSLRLRRPAIPVSPTSDPQAAIPLGRPSAEAGKQALQAIRSGVTLWEEGKIEALVTAPVSKESLRLAGCSYPGHTELLAHLTKARKSAMMFVAGNLRVILATIHLPLRKVPSLLTPQLIWGKALLAEEALRAYFGVEKPRMALCGLNPHAGEEGQFGWEEKKILAPVVKALARKGLAISGPYAADALFSSQARKKYDAIIALYHDQGLIPIKAIASKHCVNLTLGLPMIRTSPGHGTAYDIAGKGLADPSSMIAAIEVACEILKRKKA
jgi:4-hydroxythreonine-4-phosphate dehydrogenase